MPAILSARSKSAAVMVLFFATLPFSAAVLAQFEGDLELTPKGCEAAGQCRLGKKLRFTDQAKVVWEADAGLKTDGASIPGVFQPLIGSPFDAKFIRAAVVHDHYCVRQVRTWRQTHRMFYEALVDQQVSVAKAKVMFFAVWIGGPKWIELMPGDSCGKNCINSIASIAGKKRIVSRKGDYSVPGLAQAMNLLAQELAVNPDAVSLEQIEARAQGLRPGDFFFSNGDTLIVNGPLALQ